MMGLVVHKRASLDDLVDEKRGYAPFLKLDGRDRNLARAIVITALRHRCQILAILDKCWKRPPPKRAELLGNVLVIAAAQILFMNVPNRAAVDLAVKIVRNDERTRRFASFANAVLRKVSAHGDEFVDSTAGVSAFPVWLNKALVSDHGRKKTMAMGELFRREPVLDINGKQGLSDLFAEGYALTGNSARLETGSSVKTLEGYEEGSWWVQDFAAAQPVFLLERLMAGGVSGKNVADLCAAPGGKTMQLASLGAKVTAVDISLRRLERLRENLVRTKLSANIICADLKSWQPELSFDAIVLDAPCSATGTIRRHPDIVWNTQPDEIAGLKALQRELILKSSCWLKPDGYLVYANCSLLKEEGENLVDELKGEIKDRGLEPVSLLPDHLPCLEDCINGQGNFRSLLHYGDAVTKHMPGMDGFFCAIFKKI